MNEPLIWTDEDGEQIRVWYMPNAKPLLESPEAIEALTGQPLVDTINAHWAKACRSQNEIVQEAFRTRTELKNLDS